MSNSLENFDLAADSLDVGDSLDSALLQNLFRHFADTAQVNCEQNYVDIVALES